MKELCLGSCLKADKSSSSFGLFILFQLSSSLVGDPNIALILLSFLLMSLGGESWSWGELEFTDNLILFLMWKHLDTALLSFVIMEQQISFFSDIWLITNDQALRIE